MTQQEAPPSRGLVAGKYELLRMIGRGGMGSVWEGRHTSLGTHVAIKFIEKEYADNEEARKRFDNEARAAATLQSKHAIQIHDHGVTDDGKPYIVMEMLIGEPLDKRLDRVKIVSLRDTAFMLQQVCRGLQKAHEHGIVHRDIKPENIFLVKSQDDDEEIAKVLDFGIAKIRTGGADQNVSSNTRTGAVLGTPFYMSPEQARGLRDIDHRTDLWSLGVIAFKCTTGRLPFEGESLGDLLVKICTVPIPMPSQFNPQLPPSFDAWFSRALDRDPSRRFASATEFSEALAYAAGLSVKARATPIGSNPNNYGPPQMAMPNTPNTYGPPQQQGTGTAMGGYAPYGTPPPYQQQQPMNITSAPFVSAPTQSTGGGKGVFIFAALVALVGIGLGTWGVMAFMAGKREAANASTAVVTTTTQHVDPPPTVVTPLATMTAATAAPTETSTAKNPHGTGMGTHPIPHGTATVATAQPTTTAAPTITYSPIPTATAHPTATHNAGDFGAGF
ncbi:MAG TPA: serine/threonine-protein kinase [Polyangiaceae bacterium]|jgi:serine/threonine-protein kinase|nr:serine/threonine-protein kinase [Polyangiaceae bacterium]